MAFVTVVPLTWAIAAFGAAAFLGVSVASVALMVSVVRLRGSECLRGMIRSTTAVWWPHCPRAASAERASWDWFSGRGRTQAGLVAILVFAMATVLADRGAGRSVLRVTLRRAPRRRQSGRRCTESEAATRTFARDRIAAGDSTPEEWGPMRIALVVGSSAEDVGAHVRGLVTGLVARGHLTTVAAPAHVEELFDFARAGATVVRVEIGDRPHPLRGLGAALRLRRTLSGADVVHAHGLRAGGASALARLSPLAVTVHNVSPEHGRLRGVYPALERLVVRRAQTVLGVSVDLERRMRDRGARHVVSATVAAPSAPEPSRDRPAVRRDLDVSEYEPLVLTVARLAPQKGLDTLLDASRRWARRTSVPSVVIVGEGPLREELQERIDAERLPVRLVGYREDIADLLAAADVFVLPSLWEGASLVMMEAMRAALPAVATRVGGIPERYANASLLVPARDAGALATAVGRVLDDPDFANRLRAAAAMKAVTLPTESDVVAQLEVMYAELASDRGFPSPGNKV